MPPHPGGIFSQRVAIGQKTFQSFFPPPARATKYDAIFARKFDAVLFRGFFLEPYLDRDKFFDTLPTRLLYFWREELAQQAFGESKRNYRMFSLHRKRRMQSHLHSKLDIPFLSLR